MKTKILIGVVLITIGTFALFIQKENIKENFPVACTMEAKMCPDGSYVGRTGLACEFAPCPQVKQDTSLGASSGAYKWIFTEKGVEKETGAVLNIVSLSFEDKVYPVGTFKGSCNQLDGVNSKFLSEEESAVLCYFAGGGSEIGVFNEGGKRVLKIGEVDEGDAETGGFRGNFKTVLSL